MDIRWVFVLLQTIRTHIEFFRACSVRGSVRKTDLEHELHRSHIVVATPHKLLQMIKKNQVIEI